MDKIAVLLVVVLTAGLVGCSPELREPLKGKEIEETIERCIKKKWLTAYIKQDGLIVQIYCTPDRGD